MKRIAKHIGLFALSMVFVVIFWYMALALHLRWDHRSRPTQAAEVTYQIATSVFCGLAHLPEVIAGNDYILSKEPRREKPRMATWQASLLVVPLYALVPYFALLGIGRLRKRKRASN